ncbi:MAG: phage major capsid protein [Phycisphaeraceae bacterium]|nr:phage major capsid protein [Phycisphaeraceae bacterium]
MPEGVPNSALLDLTRTTLQNLPDMDFEVALKYQDYTVCNRWFQKDKVQIGSGTSIERNIVLDTSGNAKFVRPYQKTPVNVANVQKKITAPWVYLQVDWSISRQEILQNRTPARYVNLVKSRQVDATLDQANLLELRSMMTPNSETDDLVPRGVPYWLSMREAGSSSTGGFDAYRVRYGNASTSTTKGGLDGSLAANAMYRNWAATYTSINADFVKRMRRAFHACNFKSPMLVKDLNRGRAADFRLYMSLDVLTEYEDLVTAANDNIGADLDPFHGATSFRKVPCIYMPTLDGVTYSPVYGINHAKFFPMVMEGEWMRENEPMFDVEMHNVMTTYIDSQFQFFCTNPREAGFVLHTVTS